MKKTLLMAFAVQTLAFNTVCALPKNPTTTATVGEGEKREIKIDRSYTELDVKTAIDIEYSNDATHLVLTGDAKYLRYVKVVEENGKLCLSLELPRDMCNSIEAGCVHAVLPAGKALRKISLNGACNLKGHEIKAENLTLTAGGACSVNMNFDIANSMQAIVSGASSLKGQKVKAASLNVTASGACQVSTAFQIASRMSANVSGASSFNGAVEAATISMHVSGASNSKLALNADTAILNVSGASDDNSAIFAQTVKFAISGNSSSSASIDANRVDIDLSGASEIKGDIKAKELQFKATGNSDATLKGKVDQCNATMAGASQLSSHSVMLETHGFRCDASGNSEVHIRCDGRAIGTACGAAEIFLYGDATNQITEKSEGKVIRKY